MVTLQKETHGKFLLWLSQHNFLKTNSGVFHICDIFSTCNAIQESDFTQTAEFLCAYLTKTKLNLIHAQQDA
jgi:hypothetical protein